MKTLDEVKDGNRGRIFLFVKSICSAIDKNGNPYQKVKVRDMNGTDAVLVKFDSPITAKTPAVMIFDVTAGECIKINGWNVRNDVNASYFLPKPHIDNGWEIYEAFAENMREGLRLILKNVLDEKWKTFPMDEEGPFARANGIAEASVKLAEMAKKAAETYGLDSDLACAGALLYYIGHIGMLDSMFVRSVYAAMTDTSIKAYMAVEEAVRKIEQNAEQNAEQSIEQKDEQDAKQDAKQSAEQGAEKSVEQKAEQSAEQGAEQKDEKKDEMFFKQDVMMLENIMLSATNAAEPMTAEAVVLKRLSQLNLEMDEINSLTDKVEGGTIVEGKRHLYVERRRDERNND